MLTDTAEEKLVKKRSILNLLFVVRKINLHSVLTLK